MLLLPTLVCTDACKYKPFAVVCISRLFLKIWYPLNLFSRRKRADEGHFHSYQLRQLPLMLMHHYNSVLIAADPAILHHSPAIETATVTSLTTINTCKPRSLLMNH
uniref:Uncharacterized protein n=1 Tax=Medicago truncatula TaxID=3880 RepID=A2Q1Z9_MEDTR|nr:hypothetical protein MtrDRAFT_AC149134g30v2 [Medicago truncatula]